MECDHCAIKYLIYQYADFLDRGELDSLAAMFEHGSIVNADGNGVETAIVGAAAVRDLYRSFTRLYEDDGSPRTMHMTSNVMVQTGEEGGAATASSVAVVFQAVDDFPLQPIIGVRYADRFEKVDGNWRFGQRNIVTRLLGDLSRHLLRPF